MKKLSSILCLAVLVLGGSTIHPLFASDFATLAIQTPDQKKPKTVTIELFPEAAPLTVANFEKLADKKFYKGMAFHRALPNRLVQVGDPLSKKKNTTLAVGTGGPGWVVPAEINLKHLRGSVAMGRLPDKLNPNKMSNGSQFYVVLADAPNLNGQYTVFGKVTEGLDVLEEISRSETDSNDSPLQRYVIRSIKITRQ